MLICLELVSTLECFGKHRLKKNHTTFFLGAFEKIRAPTKFKLDLSTKSSWTKWLYFFSYYKTPYWKTFLPRPPSSPGCPGFPGLVDGITSSKNYIWAIGVKNNYPCTCRMLTWRVQNQLLAQGLDTEVSVHQLLCRKSRICLPPEELHKMHLG